jgi:antitoxin component of RelBE/YafQ-DinJ toxin-antitoxin module
LSAGKELNDGRDSLHACAHRRKNPGNQAVAVLAEMGLTVLDGMRMTLTRIRKGGALRFERKVPSAGTRVAMEESGVMMNAGRARLTNALDVFDALDQGAGKP